MTEKTKTKNKDKDKVYFINKEGDLVKCELVSIKGDDVKVRQHAGRIIYRLEIDDVYASAESLFEDKIRKLENDIDRHKLFISCLEYKIDDLKRLEKEYNDGKGE